MSVIPLTIFFSLLLAGTFVVLFAREQGRRHLTSPERDSLLPLADETPVLSGGARAPRGLNLRAMITTTITPAAAATGPGPPAAAA